MNPTSSTRQVRTLRLRAPDRSSVQRGVTLLEDALRTATLAPISGKRLLFVRQLNVGRIQSRQAPATLALAVEKQMRRVQAEAIHALEPAAPQWQAVYFHDDSEPLVSLALQIAGNRPIQGWFWPLAVPSWRPRMSQSQALRAIVAECALLPSGPLALVRLISTLVRARVEDPLLAAIEPADGPHLLRLCQWQSVSRVPAATVPPLSGRSLGILRRWGTRWSAADGRLLWLASVLLAVEKPGRLAHHHLPDQAAVVLAQATTAFAPPRFGPDVGMQRPLPAGFESPAPDRITRQVGPQPPPVEPGDFKIADIPDAGEIPAGETAPHRPDDPVLPFSSDFAWLVDPRQTQFGGLFFILPVLRRLHFARYLQQHPELLEDGLPEQLLCFVARRLGAEADDPVLQGLATTAADDSTALEQTCFAWYAALRGWLRRYGKMTLQALICRPGTITATSTHIDLLFTHEQTDLRVRLLGLDLNPGWVTWLARVVTFHYVDESEIGHSTSM